MTPDEHPRRETPIRVALSNDYELALLGLAQMLARHPDKVRIVDITTSAQMHDADVVLFDTFGRLPDDDAKLRDVVAANTAKVVVYSWDEYPEEAALRHGAAGYLHKGLSSDDLVAAILALHHGQPIPEAAEAAHAVGDRSGSEDLRPTWPGQALGLSERESEMFSFIARGLSNDEIARRSFLSINTVKSHIRSAYRKAGVQTRAQAVAWAFRNGFESSSDTRP